MEALILSCSTGGGHNAAAKALQDELSRLGHHAVFLDPYTLESEKTARRVANGYLDIVKYVPAAFGLVYKAGQAVSALQKEIPFYSPVYHANHKAAGYLKAYLNTHKVDVIITTHLYPAEIITHLKKEMDSLPTSIYVSTDYTCIPFTAETNCDYYVIPSKDCFASFHDAGIPARKIKPLGLPVNPSFTDRLSRQQAKKDLGLKEDHEYLLLSGGSFGSGDLMDCIRYLKPVRDFHQKLDIIVLCGSNENLFMQASNSFEDDGIHAVQFTDKVHLYMKASCMFMSKPGGLSSTEACCSRIPFIIINPIPGVETFNAKFFSEHGCALWAKDLKRDLANMCRRLLNSQNAEAMEECQKKTVNANAAYDICLFAIEHAGR